MPKKKKVYPISYNVSKVHAAISAILFDIDCCATRVWLSRDRARPDDIPRSRLLSRSRAVPGPVRARESRSRPRPPREWSVAPRARAAYVPCAVCLACARRIDIPWCRRGASGVHTHREALARTVQIDARSSKMCGMCTLQEKERECISRVRLNSRRVPAGRWGELRSAEQPDLYLCCRLHV